MLTFNQAMDKLNGKFKCKLENNTYLVMINPNQIAVKLHDTYVVVINSNNTYELYNGGFKTTTTKDRINKYSPIKIYQKNHEWYYGNNEVFCNGMKFTQTGESI